MLPPPIIKRLGLVAFEPTWRAMQAANKARSATTADEIWLLEHLPVFTLGLAGKAEHVLSPGDIAVVKIDRGGQVTYHGPGQLVVYLLLDLRRLGLGVKELVKRIEQAVIDLLGEYAVESARKVGMPGVYVGDAKIAAIGLRVANHATFHGLSLNIDMDLEPFSRINPCGYAGLGVTQLKDCASIVGGEDKMSLMSLMSPMSLMSFIADRLAAILSQHLYGTPHG